jgi:hypothetical protein
LFQTAGLIGAGLSESQADHLKDAERRFWKIAVLGDR